MELTKEQLSEDLLNATREAEKLMTATAQEIEVKYLEKNNLSSGSRSRKRTVMVGKLLKEIRVLSIKLDEKIKQERQNKV